MFWTFWAAYFYFYKIKKGKDFDQSFPFCY